jgi:DNA-binding NarL/FixJ family response regulator
LHLDARSPNSLWRDDDLVGVPLLPVREKVSALLIDDDDGDAAVFVRLSARSKQIDLDLKIGFSVEEAWRLTSERRFDLILVDYWLGLQTSIAFISEFSKANVTPCVLLTGLDEPDIRRIGFRAGVQGFLSKEDLSTQAIEAVALAVLHGRFGN